MDADLKARTLFSNAILHYKKSNYVYLKKYQPPCQVFEGLPNHPKLSPYGLSLPVLPCVRSLEVSGKEKETIQSCIKDIIMAADLGFEPAVILLINDIFTNVGFLNDLNESDIDSMLQETLSYNQDAGGVLYFLLGRYQSLDGVKQNYFRKSMDKGFILGNIYFARLMYTLKKYSTALTHFHNIFEHKQSKFLSNDMLSCIYNDISLCHFYLDGEESKNLFWKYNNMARKLFLGVAMNNAANCYRNGDMGVEKNLNKAIKLYKKSLIYGYDNTAWALLQIDTCEKMLSILSKKK